MFNITTIIIIILSPVVSAGVGRTGAFIALDCLLDQADAEGVVDVFAITNQMRKDRINMIQTVVSVCAAVQPLTKHMAS